MKHLRLFENFSEEEIEVSIEDLNIEDHGIEDQENMKGFKKLILPSSTDVTSTIYNNNVGPESLETWKEEMSKYRVENVIVRDGEVIVESPELERAQRKSTQGKADTLKKWGTTE